MISNNEALTTWLQKVVSSKIHDIIALPGDAGVRHFFRVKQGNQKSLMAIDSDPTQENNDEFIYIAKILKQHGLCVPDIYAYDKDKGFILESDLGDELIYHSFSVGDYASLNLCYENLIAFYQLDNDFVASRPRFDERFMLQELDIFKEWFLKQYLNYELSEQEEKSLNQQLKLLTRLIAEQPYHFMHRDYHSRNLLLYENKVAMVDFQGAMQGPITYDLVSLLKDCYITQDNKDILQKAKVYYDLLQDRQLIQTTDFEQFIHWFDLTGLQRHIKVLGIVSRLYLRDNKDNYLIHLDRIMNYCIEVLTKYPMLQPLQEFFMLKVCKRVFEVSP